MGQKLSRGGKSGHSKWRKPTFGPGSLLVSFLKNYVSSQNSQHKRIYIVNNKKHGRLHPGSKFYGAFFCGRNSAVNPFTPSGGIFRSPRPGSFGRASSDLKVSRRLAQTRSAGALLICDQGLKSVRGRR